MSTKKPNIMSLSVDLDTQEKLKVHSKKRKISISALVRDLVEKQLPSKEEAVDTVILKIPGELRNDSENLRNWLNLRVEAIIKALTT